ncbi:MAG: phosphatase PAP2 family protein [Pseudomonadota bacterium]
MQTAENRSRIFEIFGPNTVIVLVYFGLLMALFLSYGVRLQLTHFKLWSIFLSTLLVIYLSSTLVQHARQGAVAELPFLPFAGRKLVRFAIDWFPLVALVTIYENLREYTGVIRTDSIDATLYNLDLLIFGVEPTVWIQKFTNPILTEYFAFTYTLYLMLPLSLGWLFYLFSHRRAFHTLTTAVILTLCIGFVLYLVFPAGPPRFYLAGLFDPPQLQGYFGYYNAMQTRFDAVNPMTYRASFPSLHVALSSLALIFVTRFRAIVPFWKLLVPVYALLVVSLWIATVYLRHHWAVDIFAGWGVAALATACALWIQKRWPRYEESNRSMA